jgi:pimeloyl-ACP methyl ester carboxylesterase
LVPPISTLVPTATGQHLAVGEWPGTGPTVVFAPGLTSTHRAIAGVAAALDGALRIVALDLRGRGNSTKPPEGSYGMAVHAADVLSVMDALGIDRAIFCGHSMGAYVATAMAVEAPERALGLVLVDGGVLLSWPEGVPRPTADELLDTTLKASIGRLSTVYPSPEAYVDAQRRQAYFQDGWGPILEHYVRYDLGMVAGGYQPKCALHAAREDWRDLLDNPLSQTRLDRVSVPVLAIAAELGLEPGGPQVLGELHVARLREILGEFDFVRVPGATHHTVTLAEPGATMSGEALLKFASRVAP